MKAKHAELNIGDRIKEIFPGQPSVEGTITKIEDGVVYISDLEKGIDNYPIYGGDEIKIVSRVEPTRFAVPPPPAAQSNDYDSVIGVGIVNPPSDSIQPAPYPDPPTRFEGKTPWHLLPYLALAQSARCFGFGAYVKYSPWAWLNDTDYDSWSDMARAIQNHLALFMSGEDREQESGEYHLAHIITRALMLLTFQMRGIGKDDRGGK